MTEFERAVYEFLREIPEGKVVTYGQIARHLGRPGASRAIGNALHVNPDQEKYPCFKVVNSKGFLAKNFGAPGGRDTQKMRLLKHGVEVTGYRVNLQKYQYTEENSDGKCKE